MNQRPEPPERASATGTSGAREAVQRWRLLYARGPLPLDSAQREQLAAWETAIVSTALPVAGLDAPNPKPRFAVAAPLSPAVPGERELLDVWLTARLPRWQVREALAAHMPDGHALVDLHDVWLGEAALPGRVTASVYRAELPTSVDSARLSAAAATLVAAESLPRERRKGDATVAYDLRPFLLDLRVEAPGEGRAIVRMTLRHDPERGIGRPDELLAALGEGLGVGPLVPVSLVRAGLELVEPPAPEPGAPKGGRRLPGGRGGANDGRSPRATGRR